MAPLAQAAADPIAKMVPVLVPTATAAVALTVTMVNAQDPTAAAVLVQTVRAQPVLVPTAVPVLALTVSVLVEGVVARALSAPSVQELPVIAWASPFYVSALGHYAAAAQILDAILFLGAVGAVSQVAVDVKELAAAALSLLVAVVGMP